MPSRCADRKGETRERWTPRPDGLEESVQFTPGYNCTDNSMRGHGVHGMEITWYLRGPAGAVFLSMGTDWIPGELRPGHGLSPDTGARGFRLHGGGWSTDPSGHGIGYHARRPQYEGQEDAGKCCYIGGRCFYDIGYSASDEPVREFVLRGEQVIWDTLEARYSDLVITDMEES